MMLDVGTNNANLRNDPLYLGERRPPLPNADIDQVVEVCAMAVHERRPHALIQFEDFYNDSLAAGCLYPDLGIIREISAQTALLSDPVGR